ncbi:hypothetical protein KXW98_008957 [Aspergillus fumigatus]|nr:hypothetical protein CNMCM8057_000079 [Aspergillus fumigatus]KAF4292999.1 hypothetical protein CNMCM8686_006779 [Aspergillus fumigatus]KAH1275831.1 hypothetical protein KXX45_005863 [Aspergillus fumigatus]KAH1282916.1 hypothetical protein KXX30_002102 [Aspergillus fumigatus]KAH1317255.1 hypothetical protein KXX38_001766 [Aspergillus fumigatus]
MATPSIANVDRDDIESQLSDAGFIFLADHYPANALFIRKSFKGIEGYCLSPQRPAVRYQCRRLFPDCWENLSYGQCYIVLMSMSRTETLEGELGKGIRQIIEQLLADEQFEGTLEGQLTRIAVHLQKPVCVWNSGNIKSGILETFIPPINDKFIREGTITVSLPGFQGSLTFTGSIAELFENLAKAGTFEQSRDPLEKFDEQSQGSLGEFDEQSQGSLGDVAE